MSAGPLLHLLGYPLAVLGIVRLRRTFRERAVVWFAAEEAGVAAIVAGWALAGSGRRERVALAVNAAWGVGLAVAWWVAGRRRSHRPA